MRFKSQQHKSTFKKAIRKKDKTDTRLMAAMYLLTADQILWNKVKGNIRESRIDYDEVRLDTVSENCYTLYSASKDMYFNTDHVSLSDIFDTKLISEKMYNVIITAINIRRLGFGQSPFGGCSFVKTISSSLRMCPVRCELHTPFSHRLERRLSAPCMLSNKCP